MAKIASSHPTKCPKHTQQGGFTKGKGGGSRKTLGCNQKQWGYDKNEGVSTQTRGFQAKQGGFKNKTETTEVSPKKKNTSK